LRVLRGGSAETDSNKWFKFDIELDESDLQAIVTKYGINQAALTVIQKYNILSTQAEMLVTIQMEAQGLKGDQDLASYVAKFNTLVAGLPKVESDADSV
jgi:hypothetical protein